MGAKMTVTEENMEARVYDVVCGFLSSATALPPGMELGADTPLLDGGALDSLGILQLTARLEEAFGIQVSDEDFVPENFETVGAVVRYVSRRV